MRYKKWVYFLAMKRMKDTRRVSQSENYWTQTTNLKQLHSEGITVQEILDTVDWTEFMEVTDDSTLIYLELVKIFHSNMDLDVPVQLELNCLGKSMSLSMIELCEILGVPVKDTNGRY